MFYFSILFLFFIFVFSYYYLFYVKKLPKGLKTNNKVYDTSSYKRANITRDRYSLKKIPDNIDAIVIGSGIGGLSTAAFLSKVGYKVLVLEQHYIAGGCTHSFEERGIEHETGIHYVGNIEKRQKILDLISETPIEWCKLGYEDKGIYDEIIIEDKHTFYFRTGSQNFIDDMTKRFPEEKDAIEKYIELVKKVSQKDFFFLLKIFKPIWLQNILLKFLDKEYQYYVNNSAYNVIKKLTNNELLIAALCGQFGDYGPTPKKASFFIHASIVNHYLEGGYYPRGGTSNIAKKIIPVIEKNGGRVLVGKKVSKIIIEKDVVTGVEIENGDIIKCNLVISSVGIRNTFLSLTHINHSPHSITVINRFKDIINKIPPSTTFSYLFVNLEGDPDDLELKSRNKWVWPNMDYDKMIDDFENDPINAPIPLFIACSCMKDLDWKKNYPGKSNAIILTISKYDWFKKWENEKCMRRSKDYKDYKEIFAKRMLEEGLYKYYPKTRGKVLHYDIGTPLTNKFYLNAYSGEAYGMDTNAYRYNKAIYLRPDSGIKGLYLAGQDICTLGFTGALMSGILCANSILGYGNILDIVTDRNLLTDLNNI
jgi:all-trans-retinol 13,14-reductase